MLDTSFLLPSPCNEGGGSEHLWRVPPTPPGHRETGDPHPSPLYGESGGMSALAFPPLELDTLPASFLSTTYRDYPLFKTEKSTHDVADALLSLKHAVVHPQYGGPLSSPSSPSPGMAHFGVHHPTYQGLNPGGPAPVSPGLQPTQQTFSASYGVSPGSHPHGQSLLHASYGVGLGVGVGVGVGVGYSQPYDSCPPSPPLLQLGAGGGAAAPGGGGSGSGFSASMTSSASHLPAGHSLLQSMSAAAAAVHPHGHHPAHHHQQVPPGLAFPAMSVNVSMSMNVGMTHSLHGPPPPTYNYGPPHPAHPHPQWPPPHSPAQQPLSPSPQFHPQYHHHHHHHHHNPGGGFVAAAAAAAAGVTQYSGYASASGQAHLPMSGYPGSSYPISAELRASGDSRFYYKSPASSEPQGPSGDGGRYYSKTSGVSPGGGGMETPFKDPSARYGRHPHPHLHSHLHDEYEDMGGLGFCKRNKLLTDKVAMAAAAAAVSSTGAAAAGLMMGMGMQGMDPHPHPHHHAPHPHPHGGLHKANLCRLCGKTYARPSTLKTHLRTHSGEKPYRCNTCSKSFSQAANLTAHIRTHSGEKPFRCLVCDRRFSQSSSVTTHMRTHSGDRPYRCRLCKKAFSDSSTLTKHLRIHSGEKPYQCKLCLLRFSQSGNLNRHMRVHANQP